MSDVTKTARASRAKILGTVLLGSTALTGWAVVAHAADAQPAAETQAGEQKADKPVEKVTVTATRRAEDILDVPYNISAVQGSTIENAKMQDAPELLRTIPGVSVVDRGQRNNSVVDGVRIRGLNTDSSALGDYAVSAANAVSTYVNDTPFFANFLLKDLERVEVLRGPQGTLYGSGSLGGTIRYITHAPDLGEFNGTVAASGSQVNGSDSFGWSADATLNIPLGDEFALRLTGTRIDYPGLTDYVNLYDLDANGIPVAPSGVGSPDASYHVKKDADTVDIWFGRATLLWKPSENFEATLVYARQSDEIGGRRQQTLGSDGYGNPYDDYENGSIQLEPSSRDAEITSLEATWDLGFATLTSSTSRYDHTGESVSENTGFYAKAGFLAFYYNYPRPMASAVRTYSDEAFVEEIRLVSDNEGPWDYIVGLYYMDQDRGSTQDSFLRGFKNWWDEAFCGFSGPCMAAVTGDQDFKYRFKENFVDRAVYGELTYHFTDALQLTGGLRYFSNEAKNDTIINLPLYSSLAGDVPAHYEVEEDKLLYKINGSWNFNDTSMIYATISEGYRRGGANAVPTTGFFAEDPGWLTYKSDSVTNYELGVKGTLADRMTYTAAIFYLDWKDAQLNTATPNWGFYAVQNAGNAVSKGLELALEGRTGDGFHYVLGYTYTSAELAENFYSPTAAHTLIGRDGDRLPGIPEHSIQINADYTTPVGDGFDLVARVSGYYQSDTENAISLSSKFKQTLPEFQIWNLSASLVREEWDLTLWMKNVFNEEGVTGVYTEAYMGSSPAVGYYGNGSKELISLPRTVGLSAAYHF